MKSTRQVIRHKMAKPRECHFCIITFKELTWQEHRTAIMDISDTGTGVESETRLEAGFVWFLEPVGGFRGGVLMWTRKHGGIYRSGIRFLHLSSDEENFLEGQIALVLAHKEPTNPDAVIAIIMQALTSEAMIPATSGKSVTENPDDNPLSDIENMISKL